MSSTAIKLDRLAIQRRQRQLQFKVSQQTNQVPINDSTAVSCQYRTRRIMSRHMASTHRSISFLLGILILIVVSETPLTTAAAAAAAATSTTTATTTKLSKKDDVRLYRLNQQLLLQSRSLLLRQALLQRGLTGFQHGAGEAVAKKLVDWECAVSTPEHPKSCLYTFDAQLGVKVIAPLETSSSVSTDSTDSTSSSTTASSSESSSKTKWITLQLFNRLRRTDSTKVDPLWHSKYNIVSSWFHPSSRYSFYTHYTPTLTVLSLLLDAPAILAFTLFLTLLVILLLTVPVWERLLQAGLTSSFVWLQWPNWARFVHAALPLKLFLGQLAFKALAGLFGQLYRKCHGALVEWECALLEECIPVTLLEDDDANDESENN